MSNILQLTTELCQNGVEFKALHEVADLQRGTSITKKYIIPGDVPVIAGGQHPAYFHNESNRTGKTIVVAGSGAYAGFVSYWDKPIFVSDAFTIQSKNSCLLEKFCFYWLQSIQPDLYGLQRGGGVPHVYARDAGLLKIPVPSIKIQQKIVIILDKFVKLQAELQAELQARRVQYEYYRDSLLTFPEHTGSASKQAIITTLGEVGIFMRGTGIQKSDFVETGVGCIHYGQIHTHYGIWADETLSFVSPTFAVRLRKARTGDLVIATTSEDDKAVAKAVAWLGGQDVAVSTDAYIFRHTLNPKYVSYFFQTEQFQKQKKPHITGTKVRRISGENLAKIRIPVPPREEQNRIVAILEKFDTLTHSINAGLPREIELRRKQYEYYRDKLLNFSEFKGAAYYG